MIRSRLAASLALAAIASAARGEAWEALPADGHVVVHVRKRGVFSAFAHDHRFEVTQWRATADVPRGDPASASVDVVALAGSLRDTEPGLSEGDRTKVNAQAAGPQVLDAERYPAIEFRSERIEVAGGGTRGTIHGTLTLHGKTIPTDVEFQADRGANAWQVRGSSRFKQSAFGIRPFSGFGGTVGVRDELQVEIAFTLRPAPGR